MTAQSQQSPRLIDAAALPDYPIEVSDRLTSHHFLMFKFDRWLVSDMHLTASYEVQGVALNLYFNAQKQTPLGTLPDNDVLIASLLRMDLARWQELRARPIGPLRGWVPCRCGDKVRLMHPVVLEVALEAMEKRQAREASNNDRAVAMRLKRLRDAMAELGCKPNMIADTILVERIDNWLCETCKGQRRNLEYMGALRHAVNAGWMQDPRASR